MRWQVLTVESPSEALNATLAEGLIDLGGTAVQEDGLLLRTFLPAPSARSRGGGASADDHARRVAAEAARLLTERAGGVAVTVEWSWQPEEDWSARWKAGLGPRRLGDHLIVTPSWTLPDIVADPDDIVIVIDPQMAFGTAEHASTRGVLRLLEPAVLSRARGPACQVLDVGTGSGILAIAADLLGAHSVDAVDTDPDAIEVARANAVHNHAERVRCDHACVDEPFLAAREGRYDVIVANVLRPMLEPLLPAFRRALRAGGTLIVGGILEDEAAAMCAGADAAGFEVTREDREAGWWSALLTNLAPARAPKRKLGDGSTKLISKESRNLLLDLQPGLAQLQNHGFLVNRLDETRPQPSVNLNRSPDDFLGQLFVLEWHDSNPPAFLASSSSSRYENVTDS